LRQALSRALRLFDENDRDTVKSRISELESELSQRLLTHFQSSKHADNYLVRGFVIVTNLDGEWNVRFPAYEVPLGSEQLGHEAVLNIPSAFHLLIWAADWLGAHEIIQIRPNAFTTPGLQGWRAVTLANVDPARAVALFDEAADAFASDVKPADEELVKRGVFWSGINRQLWAKYFRARARVVESIEHPARVKELLRKAREALEGTEWGFHSSDVTKFASFESRVAWKIHR
jgi:hypothetical protein